MMVISFNAFWKFWHGIFWGLNFGPGIFLGPFDHSGHLKSTAPLLGYQLKPFQAKKIYM